MSRVFQILSVVIYTAFAVEAQDNIFSCGGFVKLGSPVDYDKIQVALYTPEGNLKYKTDIAPNNGYYMIPVYNKGEYTLKVLPPDGWHFEPQSVKLNIDGENDPCSKSEDMNFFFKGFGVYGKIVSQPKNEGPADVTILLHEKSSKELVAETKSGLGGIYSIEGVPIGTYTITAKDATICFSRSSVEVSVAKNKVEVTPHLEIAGYSVTGSVVGEGQPIADVTFLLFSAENKKISCKSEKLSKFSPPGSVASLKQLCTTTSDKKGVFVFTCIPTGHYEIVPFYSNQEVSFDVYPRSVSVEVKSFPFQMEKAFEIKGFSVSGRVLYSKSGSGVAGVKILVNGNAAAKTSADGVFVVEQMTAGTYTIKAFHDDIEFDELVAPISPKNPKVSDIVAKRFALCGSVSTPQLPEGALGITKRRIIVTDEKASGLSVSPDESGRFCRMLSPGKYTIEPQLLVEERTSGLALHPAKRVVDIETKPVKDVAFKQVLISIKGEIVCLTTCGKHSVQLSKGSKLLRTFEGESDNQKLNFHFASLLPGLYSVNVGQNNFCWDEDKKKVDASQVAEKKEYAIHFRQSGFLVDVTSSHEAVLNYQFQNIKSINDAVNLRTGLNKLCLPASGSYSMKLSSCHKFDKEAFSFDTKDEPVISLTAHQHRVSGLVKSSEKANDVHINVRSVDSSDKITVDGPLKLKDPETNITKEFVYPFEFFVDPEKSILLVPSSSVVLFTPEEKHIDVQKSCLDNIDFKAEKGLFIHGELSPALEGVTVLVKHKLNAEFEMTAETDKDGKYKIGPLRSFDHLEFSASKPGFVMVSDTKKIGHFRVHKLSELTIKTQSTSNESLAGVLISLTGGQNYRSNNITHENGSIIFIGLSPGDYFIRPILKEYNFEPPTKMVTVDEGIAVTVKLFGRRVAYSCFGHARTLSGQPITGSVVAVAGESCDNLHEEGIVEADGSYRVSGLQPNCKYTLSLKVDPESSEVPLPTAPLSYVLDVRETDIREKDFVMLPESNAVEVMGRIRTSTDYLSSLKLSLTREGDDSSDDVIHTLNVKGYIYYFPLLPRDKKTYVLKLESSLNPHQYAGIHPQEQRFKADVGFISLDFVFEPQRKMRPVLEEGNIFVLPILLIIGLLIYKHQIVLPIAEKVLRLTLDVVKQQMQKYGILQQSETATGASGSGAFSSLSSMFDEQSQLRKKVKSRKT